MCKKVDGLLDRLEKEIDNPNFDIGELCGDINSRDLTDENMLRIASILYNKKKWYWLSTLLVIVVLFYGCVSFLFAVLFTTILLALNIIFPLTISITITLTILMIVLSTIQCR